MDFNQEQIDNLHGYLRTYLGEAVCAALEDPTVTEIKCSEDGAVWLMKHKDGWVNTGSGLSEDDRRLAIQEMATLLGKTINQDSPNLSGELPLTGDRVSASVWPSGAPAFFIRRHAPEVFSFDDYFRKGIMQEWQIRALIEHIDKRSNVIFAGATNSGKTTLLNTYLGKLKEEPEHIVMIEDTKEIRFEGRNFSRFYTSDTVTMRDQVKESMRRKPDRLVIGEVRDRAALEMLEAFQKGHRGCMATVHADSATGALKNLLYLCRQGGAIDAWDLIRDAVDVVVYMEMTENGRRVKEIMEVEHEQAVDTIPIRLKQIGSNP